jgi:hypothetical protein
MHGSQSQSHPIVKHATNYRSYIFGKSSISILLAFGPPILPALEKIQKLIKP